MLDQYISNSGYFEFPSFAVAIFTLLLALVLSTVLALTYRFTYQGNNFPNNFFQAMVLSSTVSAMVMMAVGDNLAVGFGVLGAVSIIRFRTLIRNPRNIIFIFASLSIGIATGVFGYAIAISGTVVFCITVTLLYFSPYGKEGAEKFELLLTITDPEGLNRFNRLMEENKLSYVIHRVRETETGMRYMCLIGLKGGFDREEYYQMVRNLEGVTNVRFEFKDSDEQL